MGVKAWYAGRRMVKSVRRCQRHNARRSGNASLGSSYRCATLCRPEVIRVNACFRVWDAPEVCAMAYPAGYAPEFGASPCIAPAMIKSISKHRVLIPAMHAGTCWFVGGEKRGSPTRSAVADIGERIALDYDVFGGLRVKTGADVTDLRCTGQQAEPWTGLYYLRARYYEVGTGQFLSRDPFPGIAASPQSRNPYAQVGNNPVTYVDPGGTIAVDAHAARLVRARREGPGPIGL